MHVGYLRTYSVYYIRSLEALSKRSTLLCLVRYWDSKNYHADLASEFLH